MNIVLYFSIQKHLDIFFIFVSKRVAPNEIEIAELMKTYETQVERDNINPPPQVDMTQDPFMDHEAVVYRLKDYVLQHGKLIVAYDFDDTVYDYHKRGSSYPKVIQLLKRCANLGWYMIVYTGAGRERYESIKSYLNDEDIPYHCINQPVLTASQDKGSKIYYNIMLDDKAGLYSAYQALNQTVMWAENMLKNQT